MVKALVGIYIAAVLALVAGAVSIWRLRCEGFGCLGIGVAWFARVVAFLVVLAAGLFVGGKAAPVSGLARATRFAWWVQLMVGVLAAAVWLSGRVD